jgi:hypothetical protein
MLENIICEFLIKYFVLANADSKDSIDKFPNSNKL